MAIAQRVVDNDDLIAVAAMFHHGIKSNDAQVDIAIPHFADHIRRALKPNLNIGDFRDGRNILARIDLIDRQTAIL